MDFKEALFVSTAGAICVIIGSIIGSSGQPDALILSPPEATATAAVARTPGLTCPQGWASQGNQRRREDGLPYLHCTFQRFQSGIGGSPEDWQLDLFGTGERILTRTRPSPVVQYRQADPDNILGRTEVDAALLRLR